MFDGAVHLLSRTTGDTPAPSGSGVVTPRRRGRLRVPNLSADAGAAAVDVDTCLDPERFAGLADAFFWSEDVTVERAVCWAEANASAVAQARAEGRTHARLADQFGVTVPTIRHALKIAAASEPGLAPLPRKMRRARWQDSHADAVWALRQEGRSMKELAAHFGVSEPLIRAALKIVADRTAPTEPPTEPPPQSGSEVE